MVPPPYRSPLRAYVTFVLEDFLIIHDCRIVQKDQVGELILCMPSKKAHKVCPDCKSKSVYYAKFCHYCTADIDKVETTYFHREQTHIDVCHPVSPEARDTINGVVFPLYDEALALGVQLIERSYPIRSVVTNG
jgi:DNA-binding cell septation regulator SpoVG